MTVSNTLATIKSDYYGGGSLIPLVLQTGGNTNQLYLSTSGNVGIGTSSPSYKLHVATNAGFTAEFQNTAGANHRPVRWTNNSAATVGTLGADFTANEFILQAVGTPLVFGAGTSGTERMRIDSSGNVAIGASTSLDNKLEVNGGNVRVRGTSTPSVKFNNGDLETVAIKLNSGATGTLGLRDNNVLIDSSGNVGIGVSPSTKLDVVGTYRMQLRTDDAVPELRSITANGSAFKELGLNGLDLRFFTSSTERMRIDSSGRVLVGITGASGFGTLESNDLAITGQTILARASGSVLVGTTTAGSAVAGSIVVAGGVYLGGTGAANKLDDVETGTWTPAFTFGTSGSVTYTTQLGTYRKVGSLVFVSIAFSIASVSSPTGAVTVNNLPFASGSDSNFGAMTIGQVRSLVTARPDLAIYQNPSTSTLTFSTQASSAGFVQFQGSDLKAGTVLFISGCYISA